jgi:hypothetical protein
LPVVGGGVDEALEEGGVFGGGLFFDFDGLGEVGEVLGEVGLVVGG